MLLDHYVSAMDSWKGRIDSETDYDAFRWHQWVQPIDLNDGSAPFTGKLGFAFIGFCSDKGVARNKGRTGMPESARIAPVARIVPVLSAYFHSPVKTVSGCMHSSTVFSHLSAPEYAF